jgi:hypothetical protein
MARGPQNIPPHRPQGGEQPHYNPELFKLIPGSYIHPMNADIEATLAERSMYGWWWRFLRISPDYPPNLDQRADPVRARMHDDFGELGADFLAWWHGGGRDLFKEQGNLPLVRALEAGGRVEIGRHEIALVLPMTVSRDILLQQVDRLLANFHDGHDLEQQRFSTARRRLHPMKRYKTDRYLNMIDVISSHRASPDMPLYEIGADYGVAPKYLIEPGDQQGDKNTKREFMEKEVRAIIRKGEAIAHNAALGVFPYEAKKLRSDEAWAMTAYVWE